MSRKTRKPDSISLAEILGALSYALDLTEGQPEGHCVRCCWIGSHIGAEIGLDAQRQWELYYTLLLKDLGCSSNAARVCQLYMTDDIAFKRDAKYINGSAAQALQFILQHTGVNEGFATRARQALSVLMNIGETTAELFETRCHAGAGIARQLRFPEPVAMGIQCLDEHWDGNGNPAGAAGEDIPVYAQIALLSQVVDVFNLTSGRQNAIEEVKKRAGTWFNPVLVSAFERVAADADFWTALGSPDLQSKIFSLSPARTISNLDNSYIDDIAIGFSQVIDAKSPYTAGHSQRVQHYAELVAQEMKLPARDRRLVSWGALLHDIGKLAISNTVLDKTGKLSAAEWDQIKLHPVYSEDILSRVSVFAPIASIGAAHHERLDGKGYPHGLKGDEIDLLTRIVTVADVYDALTSDRPYRAGTSTKHVLELMEKDVGTAFDPDCFAALKKVIRKPAQKTAA